MKAIVMLVVLAMAAAEKPSARYGAPDHGPHIAIIRDDRVHPDAEGRYSFDVETEDGIRRQEAGAPGGNQQGSVSFTFPDGQVFDLQFVADEEGYKPQSPFLPVAPEFPHPIPQFVLDQIAFAAAEDAKRPRGDSPSRGYVSPNK
ncbi:cuticle protein AM1199-like [Panulirus ornatus]|uniref:cuticle protein AM1199-like n=1 Tax=Panulirus ornatus TaxID=150431 RepID=UPI003A841510